MRLLNRNFGAEILSTNFIKSLLTALHPPPILLLYTKSLSHPWVKSLVSNPTHELSVINEWRQKTLVSLDVFQTRRPWNPIWCWRSWPLKEKLLYGKIDASWGTYQSTRLSYQLLFTQPSKLLNMDRVIADSLELAPYQK